MQRRFAFVSLVLAAAATPALAADRKVPSADYPTISAAVAAAQPGDRIVVGPGIYAENVVTSVANLQFIGKKAVWDGTTLAGVAGRCLVSTGGGTLVQGFTFRNGGATQVELSGDGCRVVKCASRNAREFLRLTGNGALVQSVLVRNSRAAIADASVLVTGDGATVDRCTFRSCASQALRVTGDTATIVKCLIQSVDDGGGIEVLGQNAQVLKNRVSNVDSNGINVLSDGATVTGNRVADTTGNGIRVSASGATISKNSVQGARESGICVGGNGATISSNTVVVAGLRGIEVEGDGATVDGNSITRTGDDGISTDGDSPTVTRNRVSFTTDSASGVKVRTGDLNTSGLVESNTAADCTEYGVELRGSGVTARSNSALRCGTEGEGGFLVVGSSNVLEGNTATECGNDGFYIEGDRNSLTRCVATNCFADGFDIDGGSGQTFTDCRATGCDGEGLDNSGANTNVNGCTFTKNRLDVANDGTISNAGTFAADNKFKSGGTTTAPQVE